MKKLYLLTLLIVLSFISLSAQTVYCTEIFNPTVKTLQVNVQNQQFSLPIITLNGTDVLQVSFDEMSHNAHSYSYKVLHCDADWTKSNLSSTEYINGFTTANITNQSLSVNTTFLYTHYQFSLPNDDMNFKISGNYVILIYDDNQQDKPVAQACFSIVEPSVVITGNIRANTDTEINGRLQQLDFNVDLNGYSVQDPTSEIKVVVRQNNRIDNQVSDLKPTYFSGSTFNYINNKSLIFEGGNEYHQFDISSEYIGGVGIESTRFVRPYYHAYLYPNTITKSYIYEPDVNGNFVINLQNSTNPDVEADYMYVHFNLPISQPFFDGQLYIGGAFNYNLMDDTVKMNYDGNAGLYYQTLLLKQGGYNYQYWFRKKGSTTATVERVDGSFWQTGNEYTIYVYHRPWGGRYDKLIGIKDLQ